MLGAVLAVTNGRHCRDSCTCVRRGVSGVIFALGVDLAGVEVEGDLGWPLCVPWPTSCPCCWGYLFFIFSDSVSRPSCPRCVGCCWGVYLLFFFLPGCVLVCWFVACWTLTAHAANGCLPSVTESCPIVFKAQWRDEACAGEGECACLHLCAG